MTGWERKLRDFVLRHKLKILVAVATLMSLYARFVWRGFVSGDMQYFLLPWYDEIQSMGGWKALQTQVGNYQVSYQILIALLSCLPIHPLYGYKLVSILFDYALAWAVSACVSDLTKNRMKAAISWCVLVNLPVTVLNSAVWGQCDSIFTFFLVLTFLFLMREKYSLALLFYGCSLAFKLQAVFFLPFLLFYYVWSRKFSIWKFLFLPLPMAATWAAAMLQGRSFGDLLGIYVDQTQTFPIISLNYPSFWNLLVANQAENGADRYAELHVLCIITAVLFLAVMTIWLLQKKDLSGHALLMICTLMMYACVLFLPSMHERYAYPVLIFAVMACFCCSRVIPSALVMLIIDLQTYGMYLFSGESMQWEALVLLNLAGFLWLAFLTVQKTGGQQGVKE